MLYVQNFEAINGALLFQQQGMLIPFKIDLPSNKGKKMSKRCILKISLIPTPIQTYHVFISVSTASDYSHNY